MKKNLFSIIIMALLIVNLVLTSIMMFSVLGESRKSAKLVSSIATVLDLQLSSDAAGEEAETVVSIDDTAVYVLSDSMTIPLLMGEDGKEHYFLVSVSLSMNTKDSDYKTYGTVEDLTAKESLIKSEISTVISSYTIERCRESQDQIRQEILERLQALYDSKFIFNVTFSDTYYS